MNEDIGDNFSITQDGMLTMKDRVCVFDVEDLRILIMKEAHCLTYVMHPGNTKMSCMSTSEGRTSETF